jgi:hypothetical protein
MRCHQPRSRLTTYQNWYVPKTAALVLTLSGAATIPAAESFIADSHSARGKAASLVWSPGGALFQEKGLTCMRRARRTRDIATESTR